MSRNRIIKITYLVIISIGIIISTIFLYDKIKLKNEPEKETIKETITPLLFEVTKEGSSNKLYLFGSIHVANISKIEFPKYIMDAYNNSQYLACEFNIVEYEKNQEKILEELLNISYQNGTTIKDHLDTSTYEKLVNFLKSKNNYSELYDYYKPVFFESLLSLQMATDANINPNTGIDDYFLKLASSNNKNILEVESAEFQFNLSNNFPDKLYNLMFNEMVDNYNDNVDSLKELYQAWCDGNKDELIKVIDDDLEIKNDYTKEEVLMIEDYNKKMNDDRNKVMTEKAIEYFNNNLDVFYMVGTAHIVGKTGLINSLQEQGFIVTQVK